MNSCLYECEVMHARLTPRRHRFSYRLFYFAVDLDELAALDRRLRLFSYGRRNLFSFRDRDFLPIDEPVHRGTTTDAHSATESTHGRSGDPTALKSRVLAFLGQRGIEISGARVLLVTLPRIAGYLFNPVSFYFCFDRDGRPVAALAEVTNTFREVKAFVLGPETRLERPGTNPAHAETPVVFRSRQTKHFYVSPFSDVDVAFEFRLSPPGPRLQVQIDDFAGAERTLTSTVTGRRTELTDARLAWYTVRYPLLTLRVITLIHWHALRLWLKRVPWFPKAARAEEQRELYRPHASLRPADRPAPTRAHPVALQS